MLKIQALGTHQCRCHPKLSGEDEMMRKGNCVMRRAGRVIRCTHGLTENLNCPNTSSNELLFLLAFLHCSFSLYLFFISLLSRGLSAGDWQSIFLALRLPLSALTHATSLLRDKRTGREKRGNMATEIDLSLLASEEGSSEPIQTSKLTKSLLSAAPNLDLQTYSFHYTRGPLVLDASLITTDFDSLRFEAAALNQLNLSSLTKHPTTVLVSDEEENEFSPSPSPTPPLPTSPLLISSPYNNPTHYLDLRTLSHPHLLFAKALTALAPARSDYATAPYTSALNFPVVFSYLHHFAKEENYVWNEDVVFYVVVFRSQLKDGIDADWLYKLDFESHREACEGGGKEGGGLLKYWFGRSDGERRNLATCKSPTALQMLHFPIVPHFV